MQMNTFHQGLSALVAQHAGRLPCDALMRAAESLISADESPQLELPELLASVETGARFVDLDDSVSDRSTGLIWTKQTLSVGKLDFKDAEKAVANLRLDGVGGWRLPAVRELLTLVDYDRHSPAIDPLFEAKSDWYWTSTPAAYSPSGCAWFVYFGNGSAGWIGRGGRAFVRAVRPSQ
jgi:hypothetical protein